MQLFTHNKNRVQVMKLKEIYNSSSPVVSFEIFPPKAPSQEELEQKISDLFAELKILSQFNPAFISVTYGAGGSTRETTLDIVNRVKNILNIQPMPHYTCVGSSKSDILEDLKKIQNAGIQNILALRGDPPKGTTNFVKPKDGFGYANELVDFIKSNTDLGIAVAGYPECHPECDSLDKDIENLKRKVDCGAEVVITQLFYDNKSFLNFVEKAQAKGVNIPIIPGILPITMYSQLERIVSLSGCKLPQEFRNKIEDNKDNKEALKQIGIEFAINQCNELLENNVKGIHFYPLNKAFAVKSVLDNLKIGQKV
jgi:methylenetetrahydrofolate reductase (NADPH)